MGPLLLASRAKEICETLVAYMYVLGSRALSILGNFLICNRIQKVFLPANCCPVVYALLGSLDIKVQTLDLTPNLRNLNMSPLENFLAKNSNVELGLQIRLYNDNSSSLVFPAVRLLVLAGVCSFQ